MPTDEDDDSGKPGGTPPEGSGPPKGPRKNRASGGGSGKDEGSPRPPAARGTPSREEEDESPWSSGPWGEGPRERGRGKGPFGGGPFGSNGPFGGNGPFGNGGFGSGPRRNRPGGERPAADFTAALRDAGARLGEALRGGRFGGPGGRSPRGARIAVSAAALVLLGLFLFSRFTFAVGPDEAGVVLRFGGLNREVGSGLHLRWPYPIEDVRLPKVTRIYRIAVGFAANDRNPTGGADVPRESLMLTGDENIVDLDFTVFWSVRDAKSYLFAIEDAEGTVKAVAESAMREAVGKAQILTLLTGARSEIEVSAKSILQATLDRYGAGIDIRDVQLLKVDPPAPVIAAFRDVQAAQADNARSVNVAAAYLNRVVPAARGQAATILAGANAYRDRIVAEATGQADRFAKIEAAYRLAPDVTRMRIYLETLEALFAGMQKVVVDAPGRLGSFIPFLGLGDLPNSQPPAAGVSAPASAAPAAPTVGAAAPAQRPPNFVAAPDNTAPRQAAPPAAAQRPAQNTGQRLLGR
ncbi:MAG: FtsH protease activity modulator HflK [Bauldia sp.]